jgi:hypothetical protein
LVNYERPWAGGLEEVVKPQTMVVKSPNSIEFIIFIICLI